MSFISAGEILGATTPVRTLTIAPVPKLPDGDYAMVESYCTDPGCDCRKTMIFVHLDRRHVSTINFGWESAKFYARWYGAPLDARTLAEMKGPSIDLNSPDLVPPGAMLAFFSKLLDAHYTNTCACSTPVSGLPLPHQPERGGWRRARPVVAIPSATRPASDLRQRSKARGLLGPEPVNSRHHGGSASASMVTRAGSTQIVAALRAADADEDEQGGMALGLGVPEHAQLA